MSEKVVFIDESMQVKAEMNSAILQFLHEASAEIESQVKRNTRVASGKTKGSFFYDLDEGNKESSIGSPDENAVWEEFGTGEYAAKGDGKKGGWYIPAEKLSLKAKRRMKRVYGKKGKIFYFTRGKTPTHALQRAFDSKKNKIKKRAEQIMKERLDG